MIILGIDPGLATIGYGVVSKDARGTLRSVAHGTITTPSYESTPVRLAMIDNAVAQLIEQYKPDAVAVEELFFNTNVTTGIRVAEARGVILVCAVKVCGALFEYTPLQVKQTISGNGRASKQQIQFMVKATLGLAEIPRPDDAADALAVAICHANMASVQQRQMR